MAKRAHSLTNSSGTNFLVSTSDIVIAYQLGSGVEVFRKSKMANAQYTEALATLLGADGYISTQTSGGINVVINTSFVEAYQTASNPSWTEVFFNSGTGLNKLILNEDKATILMKVNTSALLANNIAGEVKLWPNAAAPTGWLLLDGATINQITYADLYAIIGDDFTAAPNGTTFDLPDLRGRVPIGLGTGAGLSTYALGEEGGDEGVSLTEAQLAEHNHLMGVYNAGGNSPSPVDNIHADTGAFDQEFTDEVANANYRTDAITDTGSGDAHENRQPFLAMNYIVFTNI